MGEVGVGHRRVLAHDVHAAHLARDRGVQDLDQGIGYRVAVAIAHLPAQLDRGAWRARLGKLGAEQTAPCVAVLRWYQTVGEDGPDGL